MKIAPDFIEKPEISLGSYFFFIKGNYTFFFNKQPFSKNGQTRKFHLYCLHSLFQIFKTVFYKIAHCLQIIIIIINVYIVIFAVPMF